MLINDLKPDEVRRTSVSHITIQLASTDPSEIATQLAILSRILSVNPGLANQKTLAYDYMGRMGHARFTHTEGPC